MSQGESPPEMRTQTIRGPLSDLEKYARLVFESPAPAFMVMVFPPDERFTLEILRMADDPVSASITFRNGSKHAKAVRTFFAEHSLDIPKNSGMPPTFLPNLPVKVTFAITPVVSEVSQLSKLVSELLSSAFGLSHDSPLRFHCTEFRNEA